MPYTTPCIINQTKNYFHLKSCKEKALTLLSIIFIKLKTPFLL